MSRRLLPAVLGLAVVPSATGILSLARSHASVQGADPCTCRNWKYTYADANVECGMGLEFYFWTQKTMLASVTLKMLRGQDIGKQICGWFFETIDDNLCLNVNMGDDMGQWCYVDAACPKKSGLFDIGNGVNWKRCSPESDRMTRDYDPLALGKLAATAGLELGLLSKFSYPMEHKMWRQVSSYWGASLDEFKALPPDWPAPEVDLWQVKMALKHSWGPPRKNDLDEETSALMANVSQRPWPTVFDTTGDHAFPHAVVHHNTVYAVFWAGGPAVFCVSGCKEAELARLKAAAPHPKGAEMARLKAAAPHPSGAAQLKANSPRPHAPGAAARRAAPAAAEHRHVPPKAKAAGHAPPKAKAAGQHP